MAKITGRVPARKKHEIIIAEIGFDAIDTDRQSIRGYALRPSTDILF